MGDWRYSILDLNTDRWKFMASFMANFALKKELLIYIG
jgi:hypothetical protein